MYCLKLIKGLLFSIGLRITLTKVLDVLQLTLDGLSNAFRITPSSKLGFDLFDILYIAFVTEQSLKMLMNVFDFLFDFSLIVLRILLVGSVQIFPLDFQ